MILNSCLAATRRGCSVAIYGALATVAYCVNAGAATTPPPPSYPINGASCQALPAGVTANVKTLLHNVYAEQKSALSGAQALVPVLNRRVKATTAYNAARAQHASTASTLESAMNAAAEEAQTALASWQTVYQAWADARLALGNAMTVGHATTSDFPCNGIVPTPPPRVTYECTQVYTGMKVSVDSGGTLFQFLEDEAPRNIYTCSVVAP
jgi:hypothetical protein